MSDPNPEPDSQPPEETGIQICWQRVATYLGSIALIIAMWICALLYVIREHPERFVAYLLAECPQPASADRVFWINRRTLEIDGVRVGGFFYADSIIVTASPFGLIRRHVAKVVINSGQVFTKPLYETLDRNTGKDSNGLDWTIGTLEISRGTLLLQNLVPDTAVPVRLGVRWPLIIHNLKLGRPDSSPEMNKEVTIDVENVAFVSPFDPLSPVLYLPLTEVTFTYAEFWHHHIRSIELLRPTLFVGEDLFWFTSQFRKAHADRPEVGAMAPWDVSRFRVQYGQMAVSAFGQPVVHFPFFFDTSVDDIRLDQLDKISLKSVIAIRQLNQDYPDYKIRIVNLQGNLYFSLPPSDKNANNIVNDIKVQEVSWNDIPITNVSTSMTFDPQGIYGRLSGGCEGGELSGNFEFYYNKGFTWNVDFFADKVNVQPIAEKLGGKYLSMTGELDGDLSVDGQVTDIQKVKGELSLPKPGVVHIKSMKEMLTRLPADMNDFKRQAIGIAVDTFATYPYTSGKVKCNYENQSGVGSLILDGPNGERHFDMYLHPFVNDQSSSKVANTADNQ
jgi:hypothetical protein